MKNLLKLFGIAALVTVIGFGFTACGDGAGGPGGDEAVNLVFTLSDDTPGDNKIEVTVSGTEWIEDLNGVYFDLFKELKITYISGETLAELGKYAILSEDKKTAEITLSDGSWSLLVGETATYEVAFKDTADANGIYDQGLIWATAAKQLMNNDLVYPKNISVSGGPVTVVISGN